MEPSETYIRQKRSLAIFAGLLLVAIFVGIEPPDGDHSILPFKLKDAVAIPHILAAIVAYNLLELFFSWTVQIESTRKNRSVFFSYVMVNAITFAAIGFYCSQVLFVGLIDHLISKITLPNLRWFNFELADLISIAIPAIGGVIGVALSIYNQIRTSKIQKKEAQKERRLLSALSSAGWVLNFNPAHENGKKRISFSADGKIEAGKNENESHWRLENGHLEILNSKGEVFSRFQFDEKKNVFIHTNDEDTLSIRSQTIFQDTDFNTPYN